LIFDQHGFQFEEIAEFLNTIQMNARLSAEIEPAFFANRATAALKKLEHLRCDARLDDGQHEIIGLPRAGAIRALVINQLGVAIDGAKFQSSAVGGEEDVFLLEDLRRPISDGDGGAIGGLPIEDAGFDFDIAAHGGFYLGFAEVAMPMGWCCGSGIMLTGT